MRRLWPLLALALLLSAFSPLASSLPDGLEHVAERLGFAVRAEEPIVRAPLPDYAVPGREDSRAAGAAVGIVGTALVFCLAYAFGTVLKRRRSG